MILQTVHPVRRMRGGAQAYLVEASDGRFYVVKFQNNPQHRRILINEILCASLLQTLGIPAAPGCPILVTPQFCAEFPQVHIKSGGAEHQPAPTPGWHFASLFPGDPATMAVYDYIPDRMLRELPDRSPFIAALAFDRWVGNTDSRQTIFFRAPEDQVLSIWLIDHGYAFNGPSWQFLDNPLQALYHRPAVYEGALAKREFDPWVERIRHLPEQALHLALRSIPGQWLGEDEEELESLLLKLYARRQRIHHLVEDAVTRASLRDAT
jgi:hypothetical protein